MSKNYLKSKARDFDDRAEQLKQTRMGLLANAHICLSKTRKKKKWVDLRAFFFFSTSIESVLILKLKFFFISVGFYLSIFQKKKKKDL